MCIAHPDPTQWSSTLTNPCPCSSIGPCTVYEANRGRATSKRVRRRLESLPAYKQEEPVHAVAKLNGMRFTCAHVELLAAFPMIMLICRPCMLGLFSITASSPRSLANFCT